ncbi:MAG: 2-aminoethylphosphonate aminotransferase [Spirochaetia bacterium]|nr:2-aminoethylphosphonate aminotransferase [Spirochaetia bacterium]
MRLKTQKISKSVRRTILLNPGPSSTTESVKLSLIHEDICHREGEFAEITRQVADDLVKIVHGKKGDYVATLFAGSGSICIDVAIGSLVPKDKKVMIVNNGFYNDRALQACQYYGIPVVNCEFDILTLPDLKVVEETLEKNKDDVAVVYMAHQETGTGLCNPIREVGAIAHKYGKIMVSDTTSTLAIVPIDVYKDNLDFCMASSQKGINAFTGCSFLIGKKDYIEKTKDFPRRSYYTNLYRQYSYFKEHGEMNFTPPVQIIYSMQQALKEHFAEGEKAKYQRFMGISARIRQEVAALGLEELLPPEITTGLVIAIKYPNDPNFDFKKVHDYLFERGVTIYPGKIGNLPTFRICNLGCLVEQDIIDAFKCLKSALKECGVKVPVKK